jgi:serine O-acetyltransferase
MSGFSSTWKEIKQDLRTHGGGGLVKNINIYLFNPSFRLLLNYRLGRYFRKTDNFLTRILVRHYMYRQVTKRGCQLSYEAILGKNIKFMHPLGVVIGENVIIHDNVRIWQQVTLGSHGKKGETLLYPVVHSGVKIFAGAKVIGGIEIGANSTIGANSVVLQAVPENAIAVGVPAKIIVR